MGRHPGGVAGTARAAAVLAAAALGLTGCGMVTIEGAGTAASSPATAFEVPSPSSTTATAPSGPEPVTEPTQTPAPAGTPSPTTSAPSPTTATPAPKPSTTKPTPKPTTKPTTEPTTKPTPKPTPTVKPTPTEGDTLHPGDSGAYVLSVQQRLSSLGYWLGTPDGTYGYLTSQAVMALQKSAGLGRDGVLGPATRRALRAGVRPQSRIGGTGVEIDLRRQVLLVVRGGAVTTILNTSTGNGEPFESYGRQSRAVTPTGAYSVFRTVDGNDEGPLGDLWRPRYFNGGIAVHGAASVPAFPASHGCARVSNPAMDMIWARALMPVGSRVVVY
jgi:peptidoglycan hydrolase-like protein with peptidoglycan-binding domain